MVDIKEYIAAAQPEIIKLAKFFNIEEPKAVAAYGYIMLTYPEQEDVITFEQCMTYIRKMLKQPISTLTYEEVCMGKLLGIIVDKQQPIVSNKIGRNEQCACGSGKKYKKCCSLLNFKP